MSLPALDLGLVIPTHDDAPALARLLAQARRLGVFSQIVVVDDGSALPVERADDITLLRNDSPKGSGTARNQGLELVRTDYVLFFDADDFITDEMCFLVSDLAASQQDFDLCLFKYADSREARAGHWGQPGWDERFWAATGLGPRALTEAPGDALPLLAQTANYPWNRISRTAFLRDHGVACAPTRVHNDVPPHWQGLTAAKRVLVSDRICAWHDVRPRGGRLTNAMGAERLAVFEALTPAAEAVAARADPAWSAAFASFALGLVDWIAERIAPDHLDALRDRERAFLKTHLLPFPGPDLALAQRIAARAEDPA